MENTDHNFSDATRQGWLRLMALAPVAALETAADLLAAHEFTYLAPPEIGLAMVRGRPGGSAAAFNLGEMTLTRCVVATPSAECSPNNLNVDVISRDRCNFSPASAPPTPPASAPPTPPRATRCLLA